MVVIKTNNLTGGALCTALTVALMFAACYLPVSVAILFVTSVIMGVCLLKYRAGIALLTYLASSLLAIFLLTDKFIAFSYFFVFGIYPVVKFVIEKLKNIIAEYIVKVIIWNIELVGIYVVLCSLGQGDLMDVATFWFWVVGMVSLATYDLLFGMFINGFYRTYYKFFKR